MTYEVAVSIYKISQDPDSLVLTIYKYGSEIGQIRVEKLLTHYELYDTLCNYLAQNNGKEREA